VVPASQLATAMKEIRELQRLLGKKTQEAEILKEAVEYGRSKNVWSALVLQAGTDERSSLRKCIRPLASQPLLAARP
jgi:transposase